MACQSVWKGFEDKIVTSWWIWLQKSDDVNGPPNAPKAKTGLQIASENNNSWYR